MHVFYSIAFDTLFAMHDALKEAFSREKHTGYGIDIFRRRLACFCLVSYFEEKFEFLDWELAEYIKKSGQLDGVEMNSEAFSKDLCEAVCIMQKDGIQTVFTHRSFQEYFAAVCLDKMSVDRLSKLIPKLSSRKSDQVLAMLFDMNEEQVEEAYIIPMLKKHQEKIDYRSNVELAGTMKCLGYIIGLSFNQKGVYGSYGRYADEDQELVAARDSISKMYPDIFGDLINIESYREQDYKAFKKFPKNVFKGKKRPINNSAIEFESDGSSIVGSYIEDGKGLRLEVDQVSKIIQWFSTTGHSCYLDDWLSRLKKACSEIPSLHSKQSADLSKLLGI